MSKKTEISVIENKQITELIVKSGIEKTKAEDHVSAFHPALQTLGELSRDLSGLDKENPTKEHSKIAREKRLAIVKVRTGAEAIKDERKKALLAESNLIQSAFNLVKDACLLTESEYENIEKMEERKEKERQERLKIERYAKLAEFDVDCTYLPLGMMDDEAFQNLYNSEKEKHEAVLLIRKRQEEERIEAERLAAEKSEQERIEREAEEKRIREENERLRKEAEIREKELAKEREEAEKERLRIEAENNARLEAERKERERIQAELEKKQAEEEAEKQRMIAEQKEREAKAKALLLAPDKEKVKDFFVKFKEITFPELQSEEGKKMSIRVNEALDVVKKLIIEDSKNLI